MKVVKVDTGAAIKAAMAQRRMSQADLSAALGVNQPRASQLCRARNCTVETMCRVASAMGMSPSELIRLGESSNGEDSQRSPGTMD